MMEQPETPTRPAHAPLTIALMSRLGGSGKSTLTYLLAHHWARRGKRVHVHDLCPSQNLYRVHRRHVTGGGKITEDVSGELEVFPTGADLSISHPMFPHWRTPPWREAIDVDVILLDVCGRCPALEEYVYHCTDLILTPARGCKGPTDTTLAWLARIDELARAAPRLLEMDRVNTAPRSLLVLNRIHRHIELMASTRERHFLCDALGGTTVLENGLPELVSYQGFPTFTDVIATKSERGRKARRHVAALADELFHHAREHRSSPASAVTKGEDMTRDATREAMDEHLTLSLDEETRRKLRSFAMLRGTRSGAFDALLLDALDMAHALLLIATTSRTWTTSGDEAHNEEITERFFRLPWDEEELDIESRDAGGMRFARALFIHLARAHGVEERDVHYQRRRAIITVDHGAVRFDLRYRSARYEGLPRHMDLTIANIFFKESRWSHTRELLEFISSVAPSHNIERVILESVSRAGAAFATGMGFHAINPLASCWAISVDDLRANFTTPRKQTPKEETP